MKKILFSLIVLTSFFSITSAIFFESDASITIDQPLNEMVVLGGANISIVAPIRGDVFIGGQNISIKSSLFEDVWLGGNVINIDGEIEDDLRAGGNVININSQVKGDVMLGGNSITLNNEIGGDAFIGGEDVIVNSVINGNANIVSENIIFGSGAYISGDLTIQESAQEIIPDGVVGGLIGYSKNDFDLNFDKDHKGQRGEEGGFRFNFFRFLTLCILGVLTLRATPNYISKAVDTVRTSPLQSFGYGIMILVVTPIIAIILLATGFGAPLGGFILANYIFLWVFLSLFSVVFLADWLVESHIGKYIGTTIWTKIGILTVLAFLLTLLPYAVSILLGIFGVGTGRINDMKIVIKNR